MGDDEEGEEEDSAEYPCPAPWFTKTLEQWSLFEKTGVDVIRQNTEMNIDDRFRHLAAISVMEKARPELERQAREKARQDQER